MALRRGGRQRKAGEKGDGERGGLGKGLGETKKNQDKRKEGGKLCFRNEEGKERWTLLRKVFCGFFFSIFFQESIQNTKKNRAELGRMPRWARDIGKEVT